MSICSLRYRCWQNIKNQCKELQKIHFDLDSYETIKILELALSQIRSHSIDVIHSKMVIDRAVYSIINLEYTLNSTTSKKFSLLIEKINIFWAQLRLIWALTTNEQQWQLTGLYPVYRLAINAMQINHRSQIAYLCLQSQNTHLQHLAFDCVQAKINYNLMNNGYPLWLDMLKLFADRDAEFSDNLMMQKCLEAFIAQFNLIENINAKNARGQTAFTFAMRLNSKAAACTLLLNRFDLTQVNNRQIYNLFMDLVDSHFSCSYAVDLVKFLFENQLIPHCLIRGCYSLKLIEALLTEDQVIQLTRSHFFSTLIVEDIEKFGLLVEKDARHFNIKIKTAILLEMEEIALDLRLLGFPDYPIYQNFYDEYSTYFFKECDDFKNYVKKLDQQGIEAKENRSLIKTLAACEALDSCELIPKILLIYNDKNIVSMLMKPIYHFLLDKSWWRQSIDDPPNLYFANEPYCNYIFFVQEFLKNRNFFDQAIGDQIAALIYPLIKFSYLIYHGYNTRSIAEEIVEKIASLKIGESILIPTGKSGHSTLMLVEKINKNRFNLYFYNTGEGVIEFQPAWKNSSSYQTFIFFENVSEKAVLSVDNWHSLVLKIVTCLSVRQLYDSLVCMFGDSGTIAKPSVHKEDYEAIQLGDTCPSQAIMAFIRHFVMRLSKGSKLEKLVHYKIFKSQLFLQMSKDYYPTLNLTMRRWIKVKTDKYEATLQLLETAQKLITFKSHFLRLRNQLLGENQIKFVNKLKNANKESVIERYAILFSGEHRLAKLAFFKSQAKILSTPLAVSILNNKLEILHAIEAFLTDAYQKNKWHLLGKTLNTLFTHTSFREYIYEWVTKNLCPNDFKLADTSRKMGLDVFIKFIPQDQKKYLEPLIAIFQQRGQIDVASYIQHQCVRVDIF